MTQPDPGVFKTSGSFLRDRVAQHLQEQGFGTGDATEDTASPATPDSEGADEPSTAAGGDAAATSSAKDGASAESDAFPEDDTETDGRPASPQDSDDTAPTEAIAVSASAEQAPSEASPAAEEDTAPSGPETRPLQPVNEPADEGEPMWPTPQRLSDVVPQDKDQEEGATPTPTHAPVPDSDPGGGQEQTGRATAEAAGAVATETKAEAGKGRKGKKGGKAPLWWRILRVCLVVVGVGIIAGCGVFAYFYATVEVPDAAQADAVDEGSTFYFADGETVFAERGTSREIISYDQMTAGGDHVVEAVISAEDRGFWTEPGVSVRGTTRAVWSTITGQQVQGGSTVTQQMVRNYFEGVSNERTISRKIQEIIIAIKIDQSESKEWVMEQYLNTIYFGRQAYGIQAAAEAYYHKDVDELTAEEAAFLAAAIQQPTPFGQADVETTPEMKQRWQYVVDGMVTTGAITQAEADAMEFPAPEPERQTTDLSGYRGYMLQEAMRELEQLGYTEDMVNRQGYQIVTTFDQDMMEAAYTAVDEKVSQEELPEGINIGLSTVDPATGEVLAFFGGHDYHANQYDSSFLGSAQAGSAFKPYVLATALEQGYSFNSVVDGRGPQTINGSRIQNAGGSAGGIMSLLQATEISNNLGYINLAREVGYEEIRDTAYAAGLPEGSIHDDQLVPVMPLGANSVRPVDQASGYATFANGGVHVDAHVVREIVNREGENERPEVESNRAVSESTAADLTYVLESVAENGTGRSANLWDPDHPVAGKTGTVRDELSGGGTSAAWFVGYTPQLSTAVGVYSDNNRAFTIPGQSISSTGLPSEIWKSYMTAVMANYEPASFPDPAFGGDNEYWAPEVTPQAPADEEPATPQVPEVPEQPEIPEIPEIPEFPQNPGTGEPEQPTNPEPGDPGDTTEPEEPDNPFLPGTDRGSG
ncbi:transglycosylase domain-containing protein [Nocardiopsis sp. FIRDI 009]|uniref:transglycosylase domain-containing protein n=1 Tax=Nocardiopsis sp. FIRDI 009 TaxID=714197 RepID=UPI003519B2B4